MKAKVLIVDDEEFSPEILEELLGHLFDFGYANSGEAALAALATSVPAVILMDVEMGGGMNGYQACRAIKDNKATQNTPVMFISAHTEAEDRLKAYESGGDDYVSKPFNIEELKYKIELALATQAKRNELADKARRAANMAMMSIREAANAGMVLGFLSDIIGQFDLNEIAATTLRTLQKCQMEGAVQLRDARGHVSHSSVGDCTPVEDAVLAEMANENRIVDLGSRSAFNYDRATIMIYDMPVQEPELYGRLKDTIVKMAEALDIHMRSLDGVTRATERGNTLLKLLQQHTDLARVINARIKAEREDSQRIMKQFAQRIAGAGAASAAPLQQQLQQLALDAEAQASAAAEQSIAIEKMVATLCASVDDPAPKQTPAPPVAVNGGSHFHNVELF